MCRRCFGTEVTVAPMRLMSVAEQRYQAVLAVTGEGRTISDLATQWRVDRRTVHRWLARSERGGSWP